MPDYLFLMHTDVPPGTVAASPDWPGYLATLRALGAFHGGSAIGSGRCLSKGAKPRGITEHLAGYIKVRAANLSQAEALVQGNPVFEAGGTIEIRELPEQ
jgi:hypothetical protein